MATSGRGLLSPSENELTDLRSIGEDLRATIVSIQASCRRSARELRALGRAFQKKEVELDELRSKLDTALAALPEPIAEPTGTINVPRLDNRKKALTLSEIDQIANLNRQRFSIDWIASQAGCSPRNIKLIIQISGFSKDIRSAIDGKISSAHFALLLVHRNGEHRTGNFLRKAFEWYCNGGVKVRQGDFLLSKGNVGQYARLMGVEALRVE